MPTLWVTVRDVNTKKGVPGAFVDLNGYTAITDAEGEATLTVPAQPYTVRVTARNYSAYSYPISVTVDARLTIDLVPVVPML